jgi:hypothetical protein
MMKQQNPRTMYDCSQAQCQFIKVELEVLFFCSAQLV